MVSSNQVAFPSVSPASPFIIKAPVLQKLVIQIGLATEAVGGL
jgi:hypothetical protein